MAALLAWPAGALADPSAGPVRNFGPSLVGACSEPEGIAIDPTGNVYAATVANGRICVINSSGELTDNFAISPGPNSGGMTALLGELFQPGQGLYVVDVGDALANPGVKHGRLLRVNPSTHAVTTLVPEGTLEAPNGIAQDRHRNLYVSDSFLGVVFKVAPDGSSVTTWAQSALLTTKGQPPFGANGLAFDRNQTNLYVANTGDSRILRIPLQADGSAGAVEVFADGATIDTQQSTTQALHGADGIMFDVQGNLYVCANQANEIQVLSPDARLIARYSGAGDNALVFPASLVFKGRQLFITDLSLNDGGQHSKVSLLTAPYPGSPI